MVTNPVANMKLAVGRRLPLPRRARARVPRSALGTDGPGSNNSLDLLADVKPFALMQKHAPRDPAAVTRGRGAGDRHRAARAAARRPAARGRRAGRLPARPRRRARARARRPRRRARLRRSARSVVDTTVMAGEVADARGARRGREEVVARARERADAARVALQVVKRATRSPLRWCPRPLAPAPAQAAGRARAPAARRSARRGSPRAGSGPRALGPRRSSRRSRGVLAAGGRVRRRGRARARRPPRSRLHPGADRRPEVPSTKRTRRRAVARALHPRLRLGAVEGEVAALVVDHLAQSVQDGWLERRMSA